MYILNMESVAGKIWEVRVANSTLNTLPSRNGRYGSKG